MYSIDWYSRCLKIKEKVLFNIFWGQKFIKNAKNGQLWQVFWKPEAFGQIVLPDRTKIGEKCQNWKIQRRHLSWQKFIKNAKNGQCWRFWLPRDLKKVRCLKITEKVSFNIASEASYVYILSRLKFLKKAKNSQFWRFFENPNIAVKQCYQTGQF